VLDLKGKRVASGRDLHELQQGLGAIVVSSADSVDAINFERQEIVQWDFNELPGSLEISHGLQKVRMYPAIWDFTDSVSLSLCASVEQAQEQSRWGVLRLAYLTMSSRRRELLKRFRPLRDYALAYSRLPCNPLLSPAIEDNPCDDWISQCVYLAFICNAPVDAIPHDKTEFEDYCLKLDKQLMVLAEKLLQAMQETFDRWQDVLQMLDNVPRQSEIYIDCQRQLQWLIYQGFVSGIYSDWLLEYPRFMQALQMRLQRYQHDPHRDQRLLGVLRPYRDCYLDTVSDWLESGYDISDLQEIRWALESFRVSLFAQELGTRQPVSEKRLQKLFAQYGLVPQSE
jgi:ATP-dependent helicase HrpA